MNQLHNATSPYLLQHKDNPVHWKMWHEETFEAAEAENKPVLLSIGYAACHWCHVMAHESFEDADVAELMNQHFVSVKVDREERPDIDAIYQNALQILGEQGGWPLTMFLTPKGAPFWGGTYFPPIPSYGRPDFKTVLRRISELYHSEQETVRANQDSILENLKAMQAPKDALQITPDILNQISEKLLDGTDPEFGGMGQTQKFPQAGIYQGFWRAWQRTGEARFRNAVILMVQNIAAGGIYDHLGGGFARYTVERSWLVPHFEKMLYDQAQVLGLLTEVWRETQDPVVARRIEETLAWLDRDMRIAGRSAHQYAYASSLDADSDGEEGAYYVWSEAEVDDVLGSSDATPAFKAAYDVSDAGNWEGKNILHLGTATSDQAIVALAPARDMLLARRHDRNPPARDDKVLCDWNAMIVAARAEAGMALDRPDWVTGAAQIFDFLVTNLNEGDRLHHSFRAGKKGEAGLLEDYAEMSAAALTLYEATGDETFLEHARAWVSVLKRHFHDAGGGGYFQTPNDGGALLIRPLSAADTATPSGNGTLLKVLAGLYHLTGEAEFENAARELVEAFSGEIARNIYPLSTFLEGVELLYDPLQIVLIGDRGGMAEGNLLRLIWSAPLKCRLLIVTNSTDSLPSHHPAAGKTAQDGSPTVYICRGQVCSLPITDTGALDAALKGLAGLEGTDATA